MDPRFDDLAQKIDRLDRTLSARLDQLEARLRKQSRFTELISSAHHQAIEILAFWLPSNIVLAFFLFRVVP